MKYFTFEEIIPLSLSALVYGAAFALLVVVMKILCDEIYLLSSLPGQVLFYKEGILKKPDYSSISAKRSEGRISKILGQIFASVFTMLFFIGMMLILYTFIDLSVRFYPFFFSVVSFLVIKRITLGNIYPYLRKAMIFILWGVTVVFRLALFPVRWLFLQKIRKIQYFVSKKVAKYPFKGKSLLDKRKQK